MINTLAAIINKFNATFPTQFPNGLEIALAADAENLPLCVASIVDTVVSYQTIEGNGVGPIRTTVEEMHLQFTIYGPDGNFCAQCLETLIQAFDHVPLSITGENHLTTRRDPILGRVTREDERVARGDIQFCFTSQRQLGS